MAVGAASGGRPVRGTISGGRLVYGGVAHDCPATAAVGPGAPAPAGRTGAWARWRGRPREVSHAELLGTAVRPESPAGDTQM